MPPWAKNEAKNGGYVENEVNKIIDDFQKLTNEDLQYFEWWAAYKIALKKCMEFYDGSQENSKIILYAQKLLYDHAERQLDRLY